MIMLLPLRLIMGIFYVSPSETTNPSKKPSPPSSYKRDLQWESIYKKIDEMMKKDESKNTNMAEIHNKYTPQTNGDLRECYGAPSQ